MLFFPAHFERRWSNGGQFRLKDRYRGRERIQKKLSDINQSFKVLGSEIQLAESLFDRQDKSIASVSARNEVLNKQIDEQKSKIGLLEKALANASSSFGETDFLNIPVGVSFGLRYF